MHMITNWYFEIVCTWTVLLTDYGINIYDIYKGPLFIITAWTQLANSHTKWPTNYIVDDEVKQISLILLAQELDSVVDSCIGVMDFVHDFEILKLRHP